MIRNNTFTYECTLQVASPIFPMGSTYATDAKRCGECRRISLATKFEVAKKAARPDKQESMCAPSLAPFREPTPRSRANPIRSQWFLGKDKPLGDKAKSKRQRE